MIYIQVTDQDTGASFSFHNSKAAGGLLSQIDGFMSASINASIQDIAGEQSAVAVNSKFGQRLITFAYNPTCDVLETRHEIIAAMRQSATPKLVEFETLDGLELQLEAYVTKLSSMYTKLMTNAIFVEMRAPDWRLYTQELFTQTISVNTTETVNNIGNEVTPPVFTITGPGNAIVITNVTTGAQLSIGNLTAGQVVVIDVKNRTVTLDGAPAYSILEIRDFINLIPGENELQFNVPSGSTGATALSVEWRGAYLGS